MAKRPMPLKPRKRNPQDATRRNVIAAKKREAALELRLAKRIARLEMRLDRIERGASVILGGCRKRDCCRER